MLRGRPLKDFVGKNEKTKVIAKLQKVWKHNLYYNITGHVK